MAVFKNTNNFFEEMNEFADFEFNQTSDFNETNLEQQLCFHEHFNLLVR